MFLSVRAIEKRLSVHSDVQGSALLLVNSSQIGRVPGTEPKTREGAVASGSGRFHRDALGWVLLGTSAERRVFAVVCCSGVDRGSM